MDELEPPATDGEGTPAVAGVLEAAVAYLRGAEPEKQRLVDAFADVLGDPGVTRSVYVAKLTPNGYRNQVWQGKGGMWKGRAQAMAATP